MTAISQHTFILAKYTFEALSQMQHSNGKPLAQCYCDNEFKDVHQQGPIITFNLLRPSGEFIGYAEVICRCKTDTLNALYHISYFE